MNLDHAPKVMGEPKCGICLSTEGDRDYWLGSFAPRVHPDCQKEIEAVQKPLIDKIQGIFKENHQRESWAMHFAVEAIQKKCEPLSIKDFKEKKGDEALKRIVETHGLAAVYDFEDRCKRADTESYKAKL